MRNLGLGIGLAALALGAPVQAQLHDTFVPAPRAVPTVGADLQLGKCVNLSNMFEAPSEAQWGRWPVNADIDRIADMGFTAIRLPVRFSAHAMEDVPYAVDPAFLDRVEQVVDYAVEKGLAVIVDFHHYEELFDEPEAHADRFAVIWLQVAERFKDAPPSVSFELINEPHENLDASNLLEVVAPALAAVRATNPTRTVIWNGVNWAGLDELADSPFPQDDPYLVPTFHYYSPVNFGFDEAEWLDPPSRDEFGTAADLAEIRANLATAQAYMEATRRVPFVGEFGAHIVRPQNERDEYYEVLSEAFASIGLQSCAWGYANTFELYDDEQGWLGEAARNMAAPLAPEPPDGSPVAMHGALSISDGRVVDQHGEPVTLRGMSLFWSQWGAQYYTSETVDWLVEDWKVSAIRAAIVAEGRSSAAYNFETEFANASRVIDAAIANGIYVVVDWHAHRSYPDDAERFLTAIARRYGHLPNLIYEPFNEPLRDGVDWSRDVKPYHMQVVGAIRAIDPDNLVIVGSPSWSQDVDIAAQDPLPFANLGYTLHYYAGTHGQELRDKAEVALDAGLALMITEFGLVNADGDGPVALEESLRWWNWAEENGISWLNWSITDKDEGSAALVPGTGPAGWRAEELTESGTLLRERLRAVTE